MFFKLLKRSTVLFLFYINCAAPLFCQNNELKNWTTFLGIETGISYDDVIEEIDRFSLFKDLPKEHKNRYIGIVAKFTSKSSLFSFKTGIRYQPKGDDYLKSNYIIIPAQYDFNVFRSRYFRFGIGAGTAIELNMSPDPSRNITAKTVSFGWRIGPIISVSINDKTMLDLQLFRTINPRAYNGDVFSPGGAMSEMFYKNSGVEFGVSVKKGIGLAPNN